MALSSKQFVEAVSKADTKGRVIRFMTRSLGRSDTLFIHYFNLPADAKISLGSATGENNRMSFKIDGFDKDSEDVPTSKVRIEHLVSYLPREVSFRARHMKPEGAVELLVNFIEKIAREYEPRIPEKLYRGG